MLCCSVRCFNKASMLHFSPVSVWECVSAFECEWMSDFCGVFWLLQTIATLVFLLFPLPPHPDWFISRGTLHFYSNLASLHPYLQVLKFSFFVCLFFKSYDFIFVIFYFDFDCLWICHVDYSICVAMTMTALPINQKTNSICLYGSW